MLRVVALAAVLLAAQTAAGWAQQGWFVRVCPAQTETSRINLAITGGGQTANLSWVKGRSPAQLDLPPPFTAIGQVHIAAQSTPVPGKDDPRADLCLGYRGHIVKHLRFTGSETDAQSATDTDDCGC